MLIDTRNPVVITAQFKTDRSFVDYSRDITLTLTPEAAKTFQSKFDHYDSLFCVFFKIIHPEEIEKDIDIILNLDEKSSKDFVSRFGQGDILMGVIFKSPFENDTPKTDTNGAELNDGATRDAARWRSGQDKRYNPANKRGQDKICDLLAGERIILPDKDKPGDN